MTGEFENDICYFCRGNMTSKLATVPFVVEDSVVIVKQVPAEVCTQCGEIMVGSDVARHVDALLKQAHQLRMEVSVISYPDLTFLPA